MARCGCMDLIMSMWIHSLEICQNKRVCFIHGSTFFLIASLSLSNAKEMFDYNNDQGIVRDFQDKVAPSSMMQVLWYSEQVSSQSASGKLLLSRWFLTFFSFVQLEYNQFWCPLVVSFVSETNLNKNIKSKQSTLSVCVCLCYMLQVEDIN